MKEIIETISDELRRIASEGDAFVSLDDKSVEIAFALSFLRVWTPYTSDKTTPHATLRTTERYTNMHERLYHFP